MNSETMKDFLGTGWNFPVQTDRAGRIELSSGETDIKKAIRIILGTSKGERIMRPTFGCGIHEYVFASINATTLHSIEREVEEALIEWEPRIDVLSVETSEDDLATGKLLIQIDYRVRSTNTDYNMVYPFYLQEGQIVQ